MLWTGVAAMLGGFFFPVTLAAFGQGVAFGEAVANIDLIGIRAMVHMTGAALMVAGAVLWAAEAVIDRLGTRATPEERSIYEDQV